MKQFTFKYQNRKGGGYIFLGILGVPMLMLFLSFVLLDYLSWIFWITIPAMVALSVYCIVLFIRKSREADTIITDHEGFTSQSYGRVLYSDIDSIPPYGPLQAPPPSMRIKLQNGKKLVWYLDASHAKMKDDAAIFTAFREELLLKLKRHTETPEMSELDNLAPDKTGSAENRKPEVIQQLEDHKKRDYKYITIPVSLVFGAMIFFRTCGEDMIQEYRDKEFDGVRNAVLRIETDYEENLQEAKKIAAAYSRKFGPILLYTNDQEGTVEFIPDIRRDPFAPEINVIGLRHTEDNKQLKEFIQHPDSVKYNLVVVNQSTEFLAVMNRSIFGKEDSTAALVYFAVYNPYESLPSRFRSELDSTFRPIQYSTSINIPKTGAIVKTHLENMDYASVRAILQKYEDTYFYMVVKEQDGISPERFEELKTIVKADFEEHDISTTNFQSTRFNAE